MRKFFYLFMLSALITGLGSCSKDETKEEPTLPKGEPTSINLSLSFQSIPRAVDNNATEKESTVHSVDIFILDRATGELVTHKHLAATDFTRSDATLTSKNKIATTTGDRDVYVGINLPESIKGQIIAKGRKGLDKNTIHEITTALLSTDGLAMFSNQAAKGTFIKDNDPGAATANKISASVERMVGKGAMKKASASDLKAIAEDGTGSIDPSTLKFTLGLTNKKIFAVRPDDNSDPNYLSDNFVTPGPAASGKFDSSDFEAMHMDKKDYVAVNENATENNQLNVKYGAENTSDVGLRGISTFFSVEVKYIPTAGTFCNNTGATDASLTLAGNGDFWTTVANGEMKFFVSETTANAYAATLNPAATVYKYTGGLCYYNMYAGKTISGTSYNFYRNNFYIGTVKGVKGVGMNEPGIPNPEDPVSGNKSLIDVDIDIIPWTIVIEDMVLE